ncbi:hypothetical protein PV327_006341 [Microctonus hyperodae]|uniref:Aminoacyl-tRNA synthetase class II (G/ P/ S/T) domain-containing protein n=1 Tax=Microctonus hyperodae TaxID=165561 RepID=A0AA39F455_MICHY|nr:hypothetical protein PV327_006341 [Microctonus hyperodae]
MATLSLRLMTIFNIPKVKFNISREFYQLRRYTSTLFIPGSQASKTFAFVSPNLDFDNYFTDIAQLQRELDHRGINVDALELKNSWEFYKNIKNNQKTVENRREEIAFEIKKLKKTTPDENERKEMEQALKIQGTVLKRDLKIIKEALWELEETVIPRLLKLPNRVDDKTPNEPVIMRSIKTKHEPTEINRKNHIDIGKSLGLIEYENPLNYYLCNDAALFEIGISSWIGKLLADNDMIRVCGTDFGRSLLVEATNIDHEDPSETFLLDNNENITKETCSKLHLMGGASIISFLAMHTKQLINPKCFPICYYTIGRQYLPPINSSQSQMGLFGVSQATVVHCMALVSNINSHHHKYQFEKMINAALEIYDKLDVHYRVVLRPIHDLNNSESLRVSFELWSSSCQNYIEVGHLSMYDNYLSKRLMIAYQTSTGRDYPAIISGTLLSIPKLLGCLLEEDVEKFNIPSCIHAEIPVDRT